MKINVLIFYLAILFMLPSCSKTTAEAYIPKDKNVSIKDMKYSYTGGSNEGANTSTKSIKNNFIETTEFEIKGVPFIATIMEDIAIDTKAPVTQSVLGAGAYTFYAYNDSELRRQTVVGNGKVYVPVDEATQYSMLFLASNGGDKLSPDIPVDEKVVYDKSTKTITYQSIANENVCYTAYNKDNMPAGDIISLTFTPIFAQLEVNVPIKVEEKDMSIQSVVLKNGVQKTAIIAFKKEKNGIYAGLNFDYNKTGDEEITLTTEQNLTKDSTILSGRYYNMKPNGKNFVMDITLNFDGASQTKTIAFNKPIDSGKRYILKITNKVNLTIKDIKITSATNSVSEGGKLPLKAIAIMSNSSEKDVTDQVVWSIKQNVDESKGKAIWEKDRQGAVSSINGELRAGGEGVLNIEASLIEKGKTFTSEHSIIVTNEFSEFLKAVLIYNHKLIPIEVSGKTFVDLTDANTIKLLSGIPTLNCVGYNVEVQQYLDKCVDFKEELKGVKYCNNMRGIGIGGYIKYDSFGHGTVVSSYYNNTINSIDLNLLKDNKSLSTVNIGFLSKLTNIEGLEYFENTLVNLTVSNNAILKELNTSKLSNLSNLSFRYCPQVPQLDLTLNKKLSYFSLSGDTAFNTINLDENTDLEQFEFFNNKTISKIDITKNIALKTLSLSNVNVPDFSLKTNKILRHYKCTGCPNIVNIDFTANELLYDIYCRNNTSLTNISLGANKELYIMELEENRILNDIDLTQAERLHDFKCTNCISIENIDVSKCKSLYTFYYKSEKHFETITNLKSIKLDNPNLFKFECEGSKKLESLDVSSFSTVRFITCKRCGLKSLDASMLSTVTFLDFSENNIKTFLFPNQITTLRCQKNELINLDISSTNIEFDLLCYRDPSDDKITLKLTTEQRKQINGYSVPKYGYGIDPNNSIIYDVVP